jgi:hypothetical protein
VITVAEVYVAGLTKDNARTLIDRAHALGLPASVVRTVDGGFIVPTVVAEESDATTTTTTPTPTPVKAKRTYTRKAKPQPQSAEDTTADAVASEE